MWFYLLFLLIIALCLNAYAKTKKNLYNNLLVFIVTIVAIFRYNVGYDYQTYYRIIINENHELIYLLFSPLSALFAEIAIYFHSPQLLFVLFGVPTYILIFSTLRKFSFAYSISVLMFICLCYFNTLSIIRQALAVAITFYGYRYVRERKFFCYMLLVVLATLFHTSAVFSVIIYWLPRIQFNKLIILLISAIILRPVIFFAMNKLGFYDNYLSEDIHIEGGSLIIIFILFMYMFCLYIWLKQRTIDNRGLINIVSVGVICYAFFGPHLGGRASLYFEIYFYLLLPNLTSKLATSHKKAMMLVASYSFVCFFILYMWIPFIKGNISSYVPYKLFFLQ